MPAVTTLYLCLLAASSPGAAGSSPGGPAVGVAVPEVVLLDVADRPIGLDAFRRPVLVLNFFAYWCDTWLAQWPQLTELAPWGRRLGFDLVSISIDGAWREQLLRVSARGQPPFPVLTDPGGRLPRALGVRRVPTVMVVDRRRRVTYIHEGYPGNAEVLRAVRAAASRETER
jgi:peroxiredoxin